MSYAPSDVPPTLVWRPGSGLSGPMVANTTATVVFPIGTAGRRDIILPVGGEILVPDDALLAVVVDKTANITSSPLDVSVSVELI